MPEVSVILPVYNAETYLREAIDSILSQTFTDFELIILNDGSTDGSASIIRSYNDSRIRAVDNDENKGLIFTLNRGIDLAKGKYIARMDADDIALPTRIEKQVQFLKHNPQTQILSTTITIVDEHAEKVGDWPLDRKTIREEDIRFAMIKQCCIAHPTVLGSSSVFKQFHYNPAQKHIEDYDLWLRMLDQNVVIHKLPEALLYYRVHNNSVTQTASKAKLARLRILNCKARYLRTAFVRKKFSIFNLRIALYMVVDLIVILKKSVFSKKIFAS